MNFWSDCKENSYQLQNMLKTSSFYATCINHNEEQYGRWKPAVLLKLEIFSISCSTC
jgi:hypothetical protein